jgi:hypothetical protein
MNFMEFNNFSFFLKKKKKLIFLSNNMITIDARKIKHQSKADMFA